VLVPPTVTRGNVASYRLNVKLEWTAILHTGERVFASVLVHHLLPPQWCIACNPRLIVLRPKPLRGKAWSLIDSLFQMVPDVLISLQLARVL
jgi:hypothetical protein